MQQIVFLKSGKLLGTALIISTLAAFFADFLTYMNVYMEPYSTKRIMYFIPLLCAALSFFIKSKKASEIALSLSLFLTAGVLGFAVFSGGNFSLEILFPAAGYVALAFIVIRDSVSTTAANIITVLLICLNLFSSYFGKTVMTYTTYRVNPITAESAGLIFLIVLLAYFLSKTDIRKTAKK